MKNKINKVDIKDLEIKNVCFSLTDKNDKREKKFKKQRIARGFDDSETWSLRDTIANFILPRLKVFRESTCCYPGNLQNSEEWDAILLKIERTFVLVVDDRTYLWTKKDIKDYNKGMKLFTEYFMDLWW